MSKSWAMVGRQGGLNQRAERSSCRTGACGPMLMRMHPSNGVLIQLVANMPVNIKALKLVVTPCSLFLLFLFCS